MKKFSLVVISLILLVSLKADKQSSPEAISYIQKFITKNNGIKSCYFKLDYKEKIDGKFMHTIMTTKYTSSPFKMYAKQDKPTKGLELLYVKGKNSNKVLVNPAAFPWVNISLSPYSATIRAEGHFTIFETGFTYFANLGKHFIGPRKNELSFSSLGTETIGGSSIAKINIVANNYKIINHTVKEGESIRSISKKLNIAEYSIIKLNTNISGFNTKLLAGSTIKIPNIYAKKIEILLYKKTNLPYKLTVYDGEGLFQEYIFTNIKINPTFTDTDFSEDNPSYNF